MSPTVYLVSGANRGIGLALVKALASRDDTIVYAGARNPDAADQLNALAQQHPGRVHVVKLTSANVADNRMAVDFIRQTSGRLDVVIANAGTGALVYDALDVPLDVMRETYEINTLGPLALFQATYPLLRGSTNTPKFIPISSSAGSVEYGAALPMKQTAYGSSKAALNYVTRKMRFENDGLVAFPICPGMVSTDMSAAAVKAGVLPPDLVQQLATAEESAAQILILVDQGTRDTDEFKFVDGSVRPW